MVTRGRSWTRGSALFVGALIAQRLAELAWSRRNERRLRARGAIEHDAAGYPAMVALHACWLAGMAIESAMTHRTATPLRRLAFGAFVAVQPLRYWAIRSLGDRWTTRILVPPGEPPVRSGPYRWIAHPNYVAVAAEIAAAPLVVGAWRTSLMATVLDAAVLRRRITRESAALALVPNRNVVAPTRSRSESISASR